VKTNKLLRHSVAQLNERENAAGYVFPNNLPRHTRRGKQASLLPKAQRSLGASDVNVSDSLVKEARMLSYSVPDPTSWPQTHSVGATERVSKRPNNTRKNSLRKREPSLFNALSSPSADQLPSPATITGCQAIAELDNSLGGHSSLPFAFDDVAAEVAEDEDDPYDCALTENLGFSAIGLEQQRQVYVRPRSPLPVTPPIWAQVGSLYFLRERM
jgi:hypothetical protein